MPHYLFRWSFTGATIKALTQTPQDREAAARQVVEAFGGRMHSYFFTLGEYDGFLIAEFPDTVSAAAASLRVSSTGAFSRFETLSLMTSAEAQQAMQKVKDGAGASYRPPGG